MFSSGNTYAAYLVRTIMSILVHEANRALAVKTARECRRFDAAADPVPHSGPEGGWADPIISVLHGSASELLKVLPGSYDLQVDPPFQSSVVLSRTCEMARPVSRRNLAAEYQFPPDRMIRSDGNWYSFYGSLCKNMTLCKK